MAKRTRRLDWCLLLALVLALVAAGPFLARPGLPRETDAELHVYRAAELGHTLRAGSVYPRWAPDFYLGYGYPIFNYYAPLTYYLANLFDLLPGVDIVGGVKAVFVLGIFVASLGAYLLGRELFGPAAGVLAAACFTFAPYVVVIDPHARGDLAEHFAVCLLPLAFCAFHRLMGGGGRGALLGSVLALAALVFSHNLLGLVAGGLLLAYWAWEVLFSTGRNCAGWGALAFALAAALIAFFWLPALWERGAIKLNVVGPGHFDFHEHFLSPGELLAPSRPFDLGATAPRYQFNLGLAQWVLALPAVGALVVVGFRKVFTRSSPTSPHSPIPPHSHTLLLYFLLAGLGLVFLMLPVSTPIWEHVPGMAYLQFPWRLLGSANLMLAVCAAGGASLLPARRWRNPALAATLGAVLFLALPVLYPPMWPPDFGSTAPRDIIEWELRSQALGTTSTGDFVPVKAARVPMHPEASLVESIAGPGPADRVNRASLPGDANVRIVEHGPVHDRFAVSTPAKFVLRLFTFYFPGWRAYVDGQEVDIDVAAPEGFITLRVPEGEHEVLVRFEDTPPRTAGWIISVAALALLIAALVLFPSPHLHPPSSLLHSPFSILHPPPSILHPPFSILHSPFFWLSGVLLLFVIVKGAIIDPHDDWLRYTSPQGQAWAAQHELRAVFQGDGDGQIELLGYDLPRQRVRSGDAFPVLLYWHALRPLDANYQSFLHVARPLHILWGQEDHLNPGDLPTKRWPVDRYVRDEYEIQVLPGTPPGEYALNVGLYSMAGGYRLQRVDERGQPTGDSLVLASVQVERPRRQPRPAELNVTHPVTVTFPSAGITLLGYTQPYPEMEWPAAWPITLFWRADRDRPAARSRDLVMMDPEGNEVWRVSGAPADYPFEAWQAGEIVRDPLLFVATPPASLATAPVSPVTAPVSPVTVEYRFGVTLLLSEGADEPFASLGSVRFHVNENEEEEK